MWRLLGASTGCNHNVFVLFFFINRQADGRNNELRNVHRKERTFIEEFTFEIF